MTRKVALVTGAAAGIGAACARRLARDGVAVGVLDLDAERCADAVATIAADGGQAIALGADISDRAQVKAALAQLREAFGPVSIIVNNAAITGYVPFLEMTEEQWETVHRVNLTGTFIVTQEALPDMIEASWGRVINIASSAAQTGAPRMAHYASSKGGMIALTRTLAVEFGPSGVTANVIPPRFITGTIMSEHSFANSKQPMSREALAASGPICREGQPEDIAGAVAWLASDEAGFVTGQVIGVNGGRIIA
ncbi:SDR family NAD(P)-dependent oxidoreductase [Novosphingobium sp. 9U]|uniref:SDR family NAD(P)-dependent oxidoreductase n=1 Tax=Novosphingobium sp. 9U TaxID=2653158 RepID=UPI0012F215E1|nr:SDR family NAD(P)-dependent oxidoreductase [Novosphingobium sp. 9U]VWX47277.1 Pyridoxal 4-dehydrogenase [Novosphingobium sp. 9U]